MPWWWPFGKRAEAQHAAQGFRDMLDEAMLRQDDLLAATERLKESRKPQKRGQDEPSGEPAELPRPNPKARNV